MEHRDLRGSPGARPGAVGGSAGGRDGRGRSMAALDAIVSGLRWSDPESYGEAVRRLPARCVALGTECASVGTPKVDQARCAGHFSWHPAC